jgi:hypothetical protein
VSVLLIELQSQIHELLDAITGFISDDPAEAGIAKPSSCLDHVLIMNIRTIPIVHEIKGGADS